MHLLSSPKARDDVCKDVSSTFAEFRANPVCLIEEDCQYQFCNLDGRRKVTNLPAYTVDVRTTGDIIQALGFAERFNIQKKFPSRQLATVSTSFIFLETVDAIMKFVYYMHCSS